MADYQNLFTQVHAIGPSNLGVPLGEGHSPRTGTDLPQVHLLGRLGMAQIGPVYLGPLGKETDDTVYL